MANQRSIKPRDILQLLEVQQYRCAYTGDDLTPDSVSADHLVPVVAGGTHAIENIRLATREVNRMKGTMSLEEFVATCRKVVEHYDRTGGVLAAPMSELPPANLFEAGHDAEEEVEEETDLEEGSAKEATATTDHQQGDGIYGVQGLSGAAGP